VAVLAPFDYASILFAILFGLVFFDEVPGPHVLVGSVIVMAAGVIIVWRERALGLQRGQARANMSPHA
jgi:drug/metabolite transporter (DMT)-like permease